MNELESLRETCKTFPQQYQAYLPLMEEAKEPPSSMVGEEEEELHQEDWNSLPSDSKKDEETSHEDEEESLETIEYNSETHSTMDMNQRASTDEWLNYKGVPIDGCSQLYVG